MASLEAHDGRQGRLGAEHRHERKSKMAARLCVPSIELLLCGKILAAAKVKGGHDTYLLGLVASNECNVV